MMSEMQAKSIEAVASAETIQRCDHSLLVMVELLCTERTVTCGEMPIALAAHVKPFCLALHEPAACAWQVHPPVMR